jgi:hypothetical protein
MARNETKGPIETRTILFVNPETGEKRRVPVQVQITTYEVPAIAYIKDPTKAYLRKIGDKGRKAIAGTPAAKERARKAAKARWAKAKQKKTK